MNQDDDAVAKFIATVKQDDLYAELDKKLTDEDRAVVDATVRNVAAPLAEMIASIDEACKDENVIAEIRAKLAESFK